MKYACNELRGDVALRVKELLKVGPGKLEHHVEVKHRNGGRLDPEELHHIPVLNPGQNGDFPQNPQSVGRVAQCGPLDPLDGHQPLCHPVPRPDHGPISTASNRLLHVIPRRDFPPVLAHLPHTVTDVFDIVVLGYFLFGPAPSEEKIHLPDLPSALLLGKWQMTLPTKLCPRSCRPDALHGPKATSCTNRPHERVLPILFYEFENDDTSYL